MKRSFLACVLTVALSAASAYACDYGGYSSIEEQMEAVDAVFKGEVLKTVEVDIPEGKFALFDQSTIFRVIDAIKGDVDSEITVLHSTYSGMCGLTFIVGHVYEVFATDEGEGVFYTAENYLDPYTREERGWIWDDYRKAAQQQ